MDANSIVLKLDSISKSFGVNRALTNVSLSLKYGQVLSIVGENGAGKSTLMKIIAGALQSDMGIIELNGEQVRLQSPLFAAVRGISIVYQEPNIFPDLSVIENMFIGKEIKKNFGVVSWDEMYQQSVEALAEVNLPEEIACMRMGELAIGTQQLALIARGIRQNCKILILDEPTSILSHNESEKLFSIIEDLKNKGVCILYISHRIPEVLRISDRIIVLRDGQVTDELDPKGATEARIIAAMSGREINMDIFCKRDFEELSPIIKVKKLSRLNIFHDVSFSVRPGEVLGIYGLVGSGRSEMARVIFGEMKRDSGEIFFEGKAISNRTPKEAVDKKIYYMPEDRGSQGLFGAHSIKYNMSISFLDHLSNGLGIINQKREKTVVSDNIKKYSIKTQNDELNVTSLSGGGQQKVLFCRWLIENPKIIILDEPTRGIDVATKTEIHNYIMQLAQQGVAVILISSDLPEVMMLSDNTMIMHKGEVKGYVTREQMTEEIILRYALGL
ncbi:MAG: sugar ABC transporter ATP-binding protein [Ruminiclostridium sp.]